MSSAASRWALLSFLLVDIVGRIIRILKVFNSQPTIVLVTFENFISYPDTVYYPLIPVVEKLLRKPEQFKDLIIIGHCFLNVCSQLPLDLCLHIVVLHFNE